ncbi:MAG TPA: hypothetical protein VF546_21230 [Pyrinomonadaceae bacterium]|jgi:hypothetical protein
MSRTSFTALLILSFVLPAAVALLAIGACGVGHGDCRLMAVYPALFPYSFLGGNLFKSSAGLFVGAALVQYPAYVLLLRRAGSRPRLIVLLAAHVVAALAGYLLMF